MPADLDALEALLDYSHDYERSDLAEREGKIVDAFPTLIAELRELREANRWRPIAEAPDGVKLDLVGCRHMPTSKGWLRGSGFYKREAMTSGFTHFLVLPDPPEGE